MLFTALLNRVFGVGSNKSRSTTGQAYPAKLFFHKYIGTQDIFEKTLQDKLDDINNGVVSIQLVAVPSLFKIAINYLADRIFDFVLSSQDQSNPFSQSWSWYQG